MSYASIMRKYLTSLQGMYSASKDGGQYTVELSFRPALDTLFKDLAKELNGSEDISVILEPKSQGKAGRPDWRIHDSKTLGIYAYIEAKGLKEETFDIRPYYEQINKYLTLKHKLVITDGLDFVFCMSEEEPHTLVSMIDKSKMSRKNWGSIATNPNFEMFMRRVYAAPSPQYCNEGELVERVAVRTRYLADEIIRYSAIPLEEADGDDEKEIITLIEEMKSLVYNHDDKELQNDKVFADFVAQVIMFCLLYAHRVLCKPEDMPLEKQEKIKAYLEEEVSENSKLAPFKRLISYLLHNANRNCFILQWVDECVQFLSFVNMTESQVLNPDYHKLFEHYLSKYDAQTRFDYGAYYTPMNLSAFVVKLTEKIVNDNFEGSSLFDDDNTLIDPCCGTGSFLEQIILNDSRNGHYNLCGFEIMPAPYMLAHYRLAILEKKYGKKNHSTNIVLANTLSNYTFGDPVNNATIEGQELLKAQKLTSYPIKLIIGNPPSSDSSKTNTGEDFTKICGLMEDFRPPLEERRSRQNIQKQINNPHMQFIRWACEKLFDSENHSVLSFIVPLSFLENESYKYARKYICNNFSELWLVAIDADARTGVRSDSLFYTLQGRAVMVAIRKYDADNSLSKYNFLDWTQHSRVEKENLLKQPILNTLDAFSVESLNSDTYSFFPHKPYNEDLYEQFWPVSGKNDMKAIFMKHCSGIKLAPTALFTHVKTPFLKRRSKMILDNPEEAVAWFKGQIKKPSIEKIQHFRNSMKEFSTREQVEQMFQENISTYSFRPYLTSNVLLQIDVLKKFAKIGGGGTRPRPEIVYAYKQEGTYGFAMAHAPKDLNPTLQQFVSFCWYYPDNDMCTRGDSHIYLTMFPQKTKQGFVMQNNVDEVLLKKLAKVLGCSEKEASNNLLFYVYGILCSQTYLDAFEGALFIVNSTDNRARVPIVNNSDKFMAISRLGMKLAEYEKADFTPSNVLKFDYEAICEELPRGFCLENYSLDDENNRILLKGGGKEVVVPCLVAIQRLNISGYDIVKNVWLKFNSYAYTHCEFTADDLKGFLDFLNKLWMHIDCVGQIDEEIFDVLEMKYPLIMP